MAKRLKTLSDVRRFLARLINETRDGKVDPSLAGRLGYLLNVLKSVITDSDIEKRVEALEKEMKK